MSLDQRREGEGAGDRIFRRKAAPIGQTLKENMPAIQIRKRGGRKTDEIKRGDDE